MSSNPQTGDFPGDYVFVPRLYGRWYLSPNLRSVFTDEKDGKANYPEGWLQAIEMTGADGKLTSDLYGCNKAFVWIKGKNYLPEPRKVHELTDNPDPNKMKPSCPAHVAPELVEAHNSFTNSFLQS